LKVKDFGLSNCINESISRLTGTPQTSEALQYKSPQQAAGEKPAIADDLYSLGATLYESLTGKPPFSARDIALQVTKKPPSMKERRAELGIAGENIPKNWEEIVADCLAEDANQRPQSASEVAKRLENAIPPSGVPLGTATPPLPPPPPSPPAEVRTAPISKALPSVLRLPARKLRLAIVGFIFILVVVSVIAFLAVHLNRLPPTKDPSPTPAASSSPSGTAEKENSLRDATTPLAESPTSSPAESPTVSPGESFKVSPAQSPTVSPGENPTPSSPATANAEEKQFAGPSSTPLSPIDINATKEDVIRRINALPGVTADKKANLIEKIDRARSMERLTVIPFEVGQTILHRPATDELLRTINSPQMRDKLSDPTIILVMLGFADTGGSPDLNLRISRERAEYVGRILKERAKLLNAMQTIGMGGSELLDSKRPGQNRAVEVWAVEPW
jgi:serine/threonine protein kinase